MGLFGDLLKLFVVSKVMDSGKSAQKKRYVCPYCNSQFNDASVLAVHRANCVTRKQKAKNKAQERKKRK